MTVDRDTAVEWLEQFGEQGTEYWEEAEHENGRAYWENFEDMEDVRDDFVLWVKQTPVPDE